MSDSDGDKANDSDDSDIEVLSNVSFGLLCIFALQRYSISINFNFNPYLLIYIISFQSSPSKGRKNIRKLISDNRLDKTTRQAAKEEEERKRRVAEKQKLVCTYDYQLSLKNHINRV